MENTAASLPKSKTPQFISLLDPIENLSSVKVFQSSTSSETIYLFPDATPVAVAFCSPNISPGCIGNDVVIIGNITDMKTWLKEKEDNTKNFLDLILAAISFAIGVGVLAFNKDSE